MSRFILIGHPVGHSLSPTIHQAAYECLAQSHQYDLVDAPDEAAVAAQIQALREGHIQGANITVPHKRLALRMADVLDVSAEQVGAANVLARNQAGQIVAYNTDALGLAKVLEKLASGAKQACVIGNGGAALAAVVACQLIGVKQVWVTARRFDPKMPLERWPHRGEFERLGALPLAWLARDAASLRTIQDVQLVVQATSSGMKGADNGQALAQLLPWSKFALDTSAYDLVYNPELTPFLEVAHAHGVRAEGGLSMLVAQAQLAIKIWLGVLPDAEPLASAARAALRGRS
jgi:shikimate dehydrogenase